MPLFSAIAHLWQRQSPLQRVKCILLLIFFSYYPLWHFSIIAGYLPGPILLTVSVNQVFTYSFLIFAIYLLVPSSLLLPAITIRGLNLYVSLGLMGFTVAIILAFVYQSMLLILLLMSFVSILSVVLVFFRSPQYIRRKPAKFFLLSLLVAIIMAPCGVYFFQQVDHVNVKEWNKSYHLAYRSVPDLGLELKLFECGPAKLLCHVVYRHCTNVGSSPEPDFLDWSDDRLTLTIYEKVRYQRSQDTVFVEDVNDALTFCPN
ncbi:MAG: hypothetical protein F6K11_11670 [Leptolyngbya sp. SIO3F4]|nr:hypothetical protein [Leptolyngbya sp. SIO3F4]